jgi:outer membrane protein OmpA-like peptidoglycan-associated protein
LSDQPDAELDAALRLWAALAAASGCRVVVEASADASGSPAANRKLVAGRARCAVVRLNQAGVPGDRIRVVHLSPQPAPNESARQRLRFVTLSAG